MMKDTGFGVSIEVLDTGFGKVLIIDNNLPESKWDKMRQVL